MALKSIEKTWAFPNDRYYDRNTHMWAKRDGDSGDVICGVDVLLLESLGELVYVSLQAAGVPARQGEPVGMMEAAKMTGDVAAPVSGVLTARNEAVMRNPSLINDDPYGAGWLVKIKPSDWEAEAAELVGPEELAGWSAAEIERYRREGWLD